MPPAARKTPQDRKPKASTGFTFDHDGKTHTLPAPSGALATIPGRAFRDAMLGGEIGELKFALTCLESVGASPEALDALYSKPTADMLEIAGRWMQSADLSGATVPQS